MPSKRRATYADLVEIPDTKVAELVDGELIVSPRPASPHGHAASVILAELLTNFEGEPGERGLPGGWWVLIEPELHLGADVLVPDVAAWRRERMPRLEEVMAFTLAPDWICEVLSPRSAELDRVRKMAIYAREQVSFAWLVEPLERTLQVFRLERGLWRLASENGGEGGVRAAPFDAIELNLSRWWMPRR